MLMAKRPTTTTNQAATQNIIHSRPSHIAGAQALQNDAPNGRTRNKQLAHGMSGEEPDSEAANAAVVFFGGQAGKWRRSPPKPKSKSLVGVIVMSVGIPVVRRPVQMSMDIETPA
jgi:hypothetical protein